MPASPSVSVLIAVHNGLPYVESALRSIMEQTLRDIEIVVVDDASTDATPEVLARLAAEDPRIRVETLETNRRLPGALNRGLELVRAPLVARMDADDIAYPERLAVQKAYMDAHPEVTLVATAIRQISAEGRPVHFIQPALNASAARWLMRFYMPIWHPTFLFRKLDRAGAPWRYDPDWTVSEDYDLIERMSAEGPVVSLGDTLLDYRVHSASITGQTATKQQLVEGKEIARRAQMADLPECIVEALDPFLQARFSNQEAGGIDPERILRGVAEMLRYDKTSEPQMAWWFRDQAFKMLVNLFKREGLSVPQISRMMTRHVPGFAIPAVRRLAKNRHMLPQRFAPTLDV